MTKKSKLLLAAFIIACIYGVLAVLGFISTLIYWGVARALFLLPHCITLLIALIFTWAARLSGIRTLAVISGILYLVSILLAFQAFSFLILSAIFCFVAAPRLHSIQEIQANAQYPYNDDNYKQ